MITDDCVLFQFLIGMVQRGQVRHATKNDVARFLIGTVQPGYDWSKAQEYPFQFLLGMVRKFQQLRRLQLLCRFNSSQVWYNIFTH